MKRSDSRSSTDEANGTADRSTRLLPIYSDIELESLPDPEWLVEDLLQLDSLAELYGDTGAGKSFVCLDLAFCVGSNAAFHDHGVIQGSVAYVYAEGTSGLKRRVEAWKQENGFSADEPCVWFIPTAVDLADGAQGASVLTTTITETVPEPVRLVIIDTLARCFGDADENSTQAMNIFTNSCDSIREAFGCTVLVVHHTGWEGKGRERGSKSLRNNFDTVIQCHGKTGGASGRPISLTVKKQKDSETPEPVTLTLVSVPIGESTSCVIRTAGPESSRNDLPDARHITQLSCLADLGPEGATNSEWLQKAEEADLSRASFIRYLTDLRKSGLVEQPSRSESDKSSRGHPYLVTTKGMETLTASGYVIPSLEPKQEGNATVSDEAHQQVTPPQRDTVSLNLVSSDSLSLSKESVSGGDACKAPPEPEHSSNQNGRRSQCTYCGEPWPSGCGYCDHPREAVMRSH